MKNNLVSDEEATENADVSARPEGSQQDTDSTKG